MPRTLTARWIDYDAVDETTLPQAYHKGRSSRPSQIPMRERRFIVWDGEGMNLRGKNAPQCYVLFGASTGDYINSPRLHTFEILDLIVRVGQENPDGIHAAFAFNYDWNMIVQSLNSDKLRTLYAENGCYLNRADGTKYYLTIRPGKWFRVTKYTQKYDRDHNPAAKTTVTIYDIWTFFGTSFVTAAENMLGKDAPGLDIVREGKLLRNEFQYEKLEYVKRYWIAELEVMRLVAEELRRRLYDADLFITQWHGPGALASYSLSKHGIKQHRAEAQDAVRLAARFAYAGGRFELFQAGRITERVYGIDINSAYPYAISQLPSLTDGFWCHVESPRRVSRFGVYHLRFNRGTGFDRAPGPVFHRDEKHNISFPHTVEGWYWSPEAAMIWRQPWVEIIEGWEFIHGDERPFAWVRDVYETRRQWKAEGNSSEWSLKLLMNSLYGKMAQRVGWDPEKNRIPPWHQLEWAGWVTSYTRQMLYAKMSRIPQGQLIAVETDGIYTTMHPSDLGIVESKELGGWSVDVYDEIMYVQSGLAWLRQADQWATKRRGLDKDTFTLDQCADYLRSLSPAEHPSDRWQPYTGQQTRFIGLGSAIHQAREDGGRLKGRHCVWETRTKDVLPGEHGKRVHMPHLCRACDAGATAYESPHDLVIRSLSRTGVMSTAHSIPWEGQDDNAEWRNYQESEQ